MTMNYHNDEQEKDYSELIKDVEAISAYTGASMKEAYQHYIRCNKDVVKAIIELEEGEEFTTIYERVMVHGDDLFNFIRNTIANGNVTRIVISHNDKICLTIPVTMGAIGMIMFPYISIIAILAWMFGHYDVIIEKNKDIINTGKDESMLIKKMKLATVDKI